MLTRAGPSMAPSGKAGLTPGAAPSKPDGPPATAGRWIRAGLAKPRSSSPRCAARSIRPAGGGPLGVAEVPCLGRPYSCQPQSRVSRLVPQEAPRLCYRCRSRPVRHCREMGGFRQASGAGDKPLIGRWSVLCARPVTASCNPQFGRAAPRGTRKSSPRALSRFLPPSRRLAGRLRCGPRTRSRRRPWRCRL
jgi:hypothetical protein